MELAEGLVATRRTCFSRLFLSALLVAAQSCQSSTEPSSQALLVVTRADSYAWTYWEGTANPRFHRLYIDVRLFNRGPRTLRIDGHPSNGPWFIVQQRGEGGAWETVCGSHIDFSIPIILTPGEERVFTLSLGHPESYNPSNPQVTAPFSGMARLVIDGEHLHYPSNTFMVTVND